MKFLIKFISATPLTELNMHAEQETQQALSTRRKIQYARIAQHSHLSKAETVPVHTEHTKRLSTYKHHQCENTTNTIGTR